MDETQYHHTGGCDLVLHNGGWATSTTVSVSIIMEAACSMNVSNADFGKTTDEALVVGLLRQCQPIRMVCVLSPAVLPPRPPLLPFCWHRRVPELATSPNCPQVQGACAVSKAQLVLSGSVLDTFRKLFSALPLLLHELAVNSHVRW